MVGEGEEESTILQMELCVYKLYEAQLLLLVKCSAIYKIEERL